MAINQIVKVRMPDGSEVALTDWEDRALYSTAYFLSGFTDAELRVFSYTQSGRVATTSNFPVAARPVASLNDTNISSAGEMDATEEMLVHSISAEMYQFVGDGDGLGINQAGLPIPSAPILAVFFSRIIGELEVSEKAFQQYGMGWYSQGFGPVISATAAAPARTYANNGQATHEAVHKQAIPVHIGGTEDYGFIFHNTGGAGVVGFTDDAGVDTEDTVLAVRVYLNGLHKRPMA